MASTKENAVDEPVLPPKAPFGAFCFNKKEGTVLGRTAGSWAKIGFFYLIYYGCLAGWFAGLLSAFHSTLDERMPKLSQLDSLAQNNPGLGMRPTPIVDYTLIRFTAGRPSSYQPYTQHLRSFFNTYDSATAAVNCTAGESSGEDTACSFPYEQVIEDAQCGPDFGYFEGSPCVVIKLNKLYNFTSEPYANYDELVEDVDNTTAAIERGEKSDYKKMDAPAEDELSFSDGNIGISCEGNNKLDSQHMRVLSMSPTTGLGSEYFPYLNQNGYRSPFVIFKFEVTKHELVQVTCKAWDKNIDNSDGQEKRGSMHFEILVD